MTTNPNKRRTGGRVKAAPGLPRKKGKSRFRKIVGKIHLWLGLASGLVVLLLSITGCIYVFHEEIFDLVHRDVLYVEPRQETLPLSTLWEKAQESLQEDYPLQSATAFGEANRSWSFSTFVGNEDAVTYFDWITLHKTIYVNPYTGEVLGSINNEFEFFQLVKWLHWSLWLTTDYGQPIVGWSTFIFVILLISGLVLWWPKSKKARKQAFSIKWKARWRRVNYDLHKSLGFYSIILALVIALTGMVWSFKWFRSLVYVAATLSTTPPEKINVQSSPQTAMVAENPVNLALARTREQVPGAFSITIKEAAEEEREAVITATVKEESSVWYKAQRTYFDQYNGQLLAREDYRDKNAGEKLLLMNYDIHTGAILGIPGKVLAFLASLFIASLPVSGFLIWYGRKFKKKK